MASRLEDLPNELLWFVFEYLPSIDLFRAFYSLNQRFNTILRLIHYRLNLVYLNQNQYRYFHDIILPNIQYDWIESLHIDDITNRICSINQFKNLRSLAIHNLRTENLDYLAKNILFELSRLNYLRLHSEFTLTDSDVNSLTSVIFSDRMPSLIYCYLGFQGFGRMTFDHLDTKTRTLSLKTLVINQWCRLRDFIRLLHFIPNIQRLTVRLFDSNTKGPFISSLHVVDDFMSLVPHLIYLRAKLSGIPFKIAEKVLFLRLPSDLRELSLSTWSIDYGDGNLWQDLLSSKFHKLKHFRLIISLDQIPRSFDAHTTSDLDNIAKSFNESKYFLDHKWNVLINVNDNDRLKFVLHTTPYPIENFQTTLYNTRRSTMPSSVIKSIYRDVTIVSLTIHNDLPLASFSENEHRYFPNVDELIVLSNLQNDSQEFNCINYFMNLKTTINLSNITSLCFSEEMHQYPTELVNLLLENLPSLLCLTMPYQLFTSVQMNSLSLLKSLRLIFAVHSSVYPPVTRIRHILTPTQILTNQLILKLIDDIPAEFLQIQTLTLIVRDLENFDTLFSDWLKAHFSSQQSVSYDFLLREKLVQFYF